MASYSLAFKQSVARDLRSIPNQDVKRILKRINSQRDDPGAEGCVKLSNQEKYRVRQGSYRIVYQIQDTELVILIVKVTDRGQVYKRS